MQPYITYENSTKGTLRFYLYAEGEKYYLFSQDYRKGVADYFKYGLRLDDVHDFSRCHNDSSIIRVLTKLPSYIKYIEKEYGITVLRQTQKKAQKERRSYKQPRFTIRCELNEFLAS